MREPSPRTGRTASTPKPQTASRASRGHDGAGPLPQSKDAPVARRLASTEFEALSAASQSELEQLVDVLKAVKQGDFTVRLPTRRTAS